MRRLVLPLAIAFLCVFGCGNPTVVQGARKASPNASATPANLNNNVNANAATGNNPALRGINLNYVSESVDQAKLDLDTLKHNGFTAVRLAIVDWGDDPAGVAERDKHWHPVAEYALSLGMRVIYGLSHNPPITGGTSGNEGRYSAAVLREATWAQTLKNSNLVLCIGNEDERYTSLSPAALRDFMRSLARSVKTVYTYGPVSYTSTSYPDDIRGWAHEGPGLLDVVGFNVYYSDHSQFQSVIDQLTDPNALFHGHVEIHEWNIDHGFSGNEGVDTAKIRDATQILKKAGLTAYFYNYRDENPDEGTHGVLRTGTKDSYHDAWKVLTAA